MKVKRDGFGGHYRKRKDFTFQRYFNSPAMPQGILSNFHVSAAVSVLPYIIWNSARMGTYRRKTEGEIGNRRKNIN